jgi:hypothetical protein
MKNFLKAFLEITFLSFLFWSFNISFRKLQNTNELYANLDAHRGVGGGGGGGYNIGSLRQISKNQ